jgi:hypothetical protein
MSSLDPDYDGFMRADYKTEDGKLHRRLSTPNRNAILQENQELQRNKGALRDLGSMGCELRIPEPDYYMLVDLYPDLDSKDADIQTRAWQRFLASSASDAYRVTPRVKRNGLSIAVAGASLVSQL